MLTGRWAKKIRGKLHYFGPWDDPNAALERYLDQRDDLYAGRTPRAKGDGLTVRDLVNKFLTTKRHLGDTGEITEKTFADYYRACQRVIEAFGRSRPVSDLAADDFERLRIALSKSRGPVGLGNEIQRIRVVFKYAFDQGLVDKPVRYGQTFKRPSRRVLRKLKAAQGSRMFEAPEIRSLLKEAKMPLRAMILLGVNCGFGNTDVASLPLNALDLTRGWVDFPRPKTGIPRRAPLWPGTITALQEAIRNQPEPASEGDAGLARSSPRILDGS